MTFNPFSTQQNHLMIGSYRVSDLAERYQTPLFIMDESLIRSKMRYFKDLFQSPHCESQVIYASKAFLNLAMCQLVKEEGLFLDVVSGGELYTAHKADFPMSNILFHGNNKSHEELQMAIDFGVGRIVVDNPTEVSRLSEMIPDGKVMNILLRVNPGIEAHTHEYIATSKHDSKFGVSIFDDSTIELILKCTHEPKLKFKGLHAHIGSQILDGTSFVKEMDVLLDYVLKLNESGVIVEEINMGGGFGVAYTKEDVEMDLSSTLPKILEYVSQRSQELGLKSPKIYIEPGRSIVANAGITVYKVGSVKTTHSHKNYVFVDGSMADHIRTALYQAKYEADCVDRMNEEKTHHYTIAGKACESGDILIHDCVLPEVKVNDYLAVYTTGAYHYSMSSNYNRLQKPAVIFVNQDKVRIVSKRETYDDLLRQDCL